MDSWKKNLYIICIAEFLVLMGFGVAMPFVPLFIKQLGDYTEQQASLWAGIAVGGSGIAMFLSAPVWGLAADRWGRKPMVLRAQFGAGVVVAATALATNVIQVVVLRALQGILTGTVPAVAALVAAMTPRDRLPFAMAMVMLSVQTGNMTGPLVGGLLAERIGFQNTFLVSAGMLTAGGFAVLFMVKEKFVRPENKQENTLGGMFRLAFSREMLPLLIVMCVLSIGPSMIGPIIPLLMSSLSVDASGAQAAGITFAIMGGTTALAAFVTSRLNRRVPLKTIMVFCCLGASVLYLPAFFAQSVPQLVFFIGITGLMAGGLGMASNTLISYAVPVSRQGLAFGLGTSAQALGFGVGPLLGGSLGATVGLRAVFPVGAALFAGMAIMVAKLMTKSQGRPEENHQ